MKTSAIILSGGQGSRLGYIEKGLLTINGETLIENKIKQLRPRFSEIIVVTNKPELYGNLPPDIKIIQDEEPYRGPLPGLYYGLKASSGNQNFLTAVDMPYFNSDLVNHYASFIDKYEIVVFRNDKFIEPFCAFYATALVSKIEKLMESGQSSLKALVKTANTMYIERNTVESFDPEFRAFFNINTPDELNNL
ncbi:molybdenum cofactor guanylyltransferase [Candidatus Margulisiibacteriota bacterium]